jgi:hypothetical protein
MDPGNEDQMQSERKGLRSRQVWDPERMMRDLLPPCRLSQLPNTSLPWQVTSPRTVLIESPLHACKVKGK